MDAGMFSRSDKDSVLDAHRAARRALWWYWALVEEQVVACNENSVERISVLRIAM